MKRNNTLWVVIIVLVLLLIITNRQNIQDKAQDKPAETKKLSDLQIEACNSADMANSCDTKLSEIGIVLKEDCCEALGKCC